MLDTNVLIAEVAIDKPEILTPSAFIEKYL